VPLSLRIGRRANAPFVVVVCVLASLAGEARAADGQPESTPAGPAATSVSLSEAIRLTRTRGYDLLVRSAEVRGAQADVVAASATPNPTISGGPSRRIDCASCPDKTAWGAFANLSDEGLVEGALTRKRALRGEVAKRALEAARYSRADAERILVAQTKVQYVQTAAAEARLDFAREVAAALAKAVEVNRVRYPRVIDEGQLARVEQEALKADQEVDRALRNLREEQIQLATLIAADPSVPIAVDREALKFRVPELLANADKQALARMAAEARPDRKALAAREAQAEAQITLARRERIPDVSLLVQYQNLGTGDAAPQPPTLSFGVALPIPIFYRRQGEIGRAEADRDATSTLRRKLDNVVAAEIESSWNGFVTARAIVTRYETALLDRARRAREITQVQYTAGSATLTDLLDAQRSFVAVNSDYYTELVNYWTAVFLLEQAVGREIVP
jgi:cobalt-zinc-cadmium efflux system outer membrane protein